MHNNLDNNLLSNDSTPDIIKTQRELNKQQKRAQHYEALFKGLITHSTDIILILAENGRIRFCNPSIKAILGFSPEDLEGTDFFSLLGDDFVTEQRAMFSSNIVAEHPSFKTSFDIKKADGSLIFVEATSSNYLNNPDIDGVIVTIHDMTKQKVAEERAFFYQNYDPLTKLPNKELFIKDIERHIVIAKARNHVFGIMILGLDSFKPVNDMFGTRIGDEILKLTANALKQAFRNDDIVSRYRGDKFIVLFPEIKSSDQIKNVIAKARSAFSSSFDIGLGQQITMSASMGIAFYPNDGQNSTDLVKNAETALYMAKETGRNRYRLFDAELNAELLERQRIESALGEAIGKRRFEPFFQPKTDRKGNIVGAEALVRWRTIEGSIKQPGSFISVAEKSNNIDRIGTLMLYKTCELIAEWSSRGLPEVPISINLAPKQFAQEHLVDDISTILELTGVDAKRLEFEITESGIMTNEKESIRQLLKIKELGSRIAIDDFGTGYSSFSKLKDYPVDTIKIDKSFIDPLPSDHKASIIAEAIIELAHTLNFSVVAEGVEKREQLELLDLIFCDQFQGFLFSRPLQASDFATILDNRRPLP